jgi:CubicO group peptidase (beta-lactamase class C family)
VNIPSSLARFALPGLACLLLLAPHAVRAADPFDGIDPYVRTAMQTWEVPGLAVAVVKDGEVVLVRGYGVCERGRDRSVTPETAFPIASCAKSFTAAGVALLVEEGKLHWDDPVVKHLPNFAFSDPYLTKHVTLRDLLCHRTGLQRCDPLCDRTDFDRREILRRVRHIPVAAEFRTRLTYHNAMYLALEEVVARVSGQPWERFVAERILRPLDMKATTTTAAAGTGWRCATGGAMRGSPRGRYRRRVEGFTRPSGTWPSGSS